MQIQSALTETRPIDWLTLMLIVTSALANYYSLRERTKIIETQIYPIVRWWNKKAEAKINDEV